MKYALRIRNNESGEIRTTDQILDYYDEGGTMYYLTEGNYGCDCNRELEFGRANPERRKPGFWDTACSHGRFTILELILEDGTVMKVDESVAL